jgi:hypothetical protein
MEVDMALLEEGMQRLKEEIASIINPTPRTEIIMTTAVRVGATITPANAKDFPVGTVFTVTPAPTTYKISTKADTDGDVIVNPQDGGGFRAYGDYFGPCCNDFDIKEGVVTELPGSEAEVLETPSYVKIDSRIANELPKGSIVAWDFYEEKGLYVRKKDGWKPVRKTYVHDGTIGRWYTDSLSLVYKAS